MVKKPKKKTSGPSPETLKIEGDWESAMKSSMAKKRPAEGWPKAETAKKPNPKK